MPANLAEQCARAVMESVPQVMRTIREEMRRQGAPLFSIPQIRALAFLHRRPGACLLDLADHLGVTCPTASTIVDRLVRRGVVARAADPEERRRVVLTLTPLGTRHLRRARQSTQAWMATALARLTPDALQRITRGVTLLGEAFKDARRDDSRPHAAALPLTDNRKGEAA
jgi:DNA-binding MarR family transcriptional regulator